MRRKIDGEISHLVPRFISQPFISLGGSLDVKIARMVEPSRNHQRVVNINFLQITIVTMLLFTGIIPLLVLIVLNTRIYCAIRTRTQKLQQMTSKQRRFVQKRHFLGFSAR